MSQKTLLEAIAAVDVEQFNEISFKLKSNAFDLGSKAAADANVLARDATDAATRLNNVRKNIFQARGPLDNFLDTKGSTAIRKQISVTEAMLEDLAVLLNKYANEKSKQARKLLKK